MWTALVIIALLVSLIGYGLYRAKTQGKLEEKLKVDELILKDIEEAKRIDINLDNLSIAAKRVLLKERNKGRMPSDDTN